MSIESREPKSDGLKATTLDIPWRHHISADGAYHDMHIGNSDCGGKLGTGDCLPCGGDHCEWYGPGGYTGWVESWRTTSAVSD